MKKIKGCIDDNCIHTPTSCLDWNGGDIEYLGICDGDPLNNLLWEVVNKLKEIAGEDLSTFDIDSLLDICNQKAPAEKTLITILELVRDNQVCLKDYIDDLNSRLNDLFGATDIDVDLKCYAQFDNLGNGLAITRDQLDQLIIDNLCSQKGRIDSLEGNVINLQSQIDNLDLNKTVDELNISTCVDAGVKPTSSQLIAVSDAHCELEIATGDPGDIAAALANIPADWNAKFGLIPAWDLSPENLANTISNLLLVIKNHEDRLTAIEQTCCNATCNDITLGFSAVYNEDGDGIIFKFTSGAGTSIPSGFVDKGSTGVITDKDGNTETFTIDIVDNFFEGNETEVLLGGLNANGDLTVEITSKLGTDALTCEKCLTKTIKSTSCGYCEITATGEDGASAVITYTDGDYVPTVVTNTTSTTTTTTVGV